MRRSPLPRLALSFLLLASLGACRSSVGPERMTVDRFEYGTALRRSWDEELLLNLVRLRYRDNPQFLRVSSVVTQYQRDALLDVGVGVDTAGDFFGALDGSAGWVESPVVSYYPLEGEEFVAQLLSPIPTSTLVVLSASGWSIERLLLCCVQEINGFENAGSAAGPTPDLAPRFKEFHRLAADLRVLQKRGLLKVGLDGEGQVRIRLDADPVTSSVRERLGVSEEEELLRVVPGTLEVASDEIAITARSILAVLFYLSQAVEPPAAHEEAGLVTVTRREDGTVFDWTEVIGGLLRIRSSEEMPLHAAVRVRHRGVWFFIDDSDLNSKTTFGLLTYLLALTSGTDEGAEPLLTLGLG